VTAGPIAIDLDGVLGDTNPLWDAWLGSVATLFGLGEAPLPESRAEAAAELDRRGAGNWRALLQRFGEERVAVYLRRDSAASAALRTLETARRELGVFTDAPEPLARLVLAHLGADRRISVLETGTGALERLLEHLGESAVVVRTPDELIAACT
jgi:phosphoglycolate phosphatase-like HAD superfamily hydrolase